MIKFVLGLIIGGVIGFSICTLCVVAGSEKNTEVQCVEKIKKDDVTSK